MPIEDIKCPDCGGPMTPRLSQHGKFWGCKAYPTCKGTRNAEGEARRSPREDPADEASRLPSEHQRQRDRRRW